MQHAMEVTLLLDYKYLWIDSLCIDQSDPKDKAREIPRMPLIYASSKLVICASSAESCHQGFLGDRDLARINHDSDHCHGFAPPFLLKHMTIVHEGGGNKREEKEGFIVLSSTNNLSNIERGDCEPLDSRAWALQERILAPRVLNFSRCGISWRCDMFACRDGFMVDRSENNEFDELCKKLRSQKLLGKESFLTLVRELIQDYTRRKLTHDSDKLDAFSAIAKVVTEKIEGSNTYITGIWEQNIEMQLLWTTFYRGAARSKTYRCPTWSWASLCDAPISWSYMPIYTKIHLLAKVKDFTINLLQEDHVFGAAKYAELRIEGMIHEYLYKGQSLVEDDEFTTFPRISQVHDHQGIDNPVFFIDNHREVDIGKRLSIFRQCKITKC